MSMEEALTCSEILARRIRASCSLGPKVQRTSSFAGSQHVDVRGSSSLSVADNHELNRMLRRLRILGDGVFVHRAVSAQSREQVVNYTM